jgi:putative addiction module component (TIGR02574 family)
MTKEQLLGEATSLSTRDRLELAIELWDSVESIAELPPLREQQVAELDSRLDAYIADPSATLAADEALDQIERELK